MVTETEDSEDDVNAPGKVILCNSINNYEKY